MVGGMLDNLLEHQSTATQGNSDVNQSSNMNDSTMGKLEDLAKGKLGSMFGGNL